MGGYRPFDAPIVRLRPRHSTRPVRFNRSPRGSGSTKRRQRHRTKFRARFAGVRQRKSPMKQGIFPPLGPAGHALGRRRRRCHRLRPGHRQSPRTSTISAGRLPPGGSVLETTSAAIAAQATDSRPGPRRSRKTATFCRNRPGTLAIIPETSPKHRSYSPTIGQNPLPAAGSTNW